MNVNKAGSGNSGPCPACTHNRSNQIGQIGGYVRGFEYVVIECDHCRCQTIQPTELPEGLYDAIYANASRIDGGYDRYVRYAEQIANKPSPVEWLAQQEDMYWGVWNIFQDLHLGASANIVELGCGFGYLTYALRKAGLNAHGVDLSRIAIDEARRRFGESYSVGDAMQSERVRHSDVLVAMELIEHVSDPASFLTRLRQVMPPTGKLIISTPNRDTYPDEVVWNTDLPPVHFHWFTELAITELAHRCGFVATFVDFSSRNAQVRGTRWIASPQYRSPRFDESFAPIDRANVVATHRLTASRLIAAARRKLFSAIGRNNTSGPDNLSGSRSVAAVALLSPIAGGE